MTETQVTQTSAECQGYDFLYSTSLKENLRWIDQQIPKLVISLIPDFYHLPSFFLQFSARHMRDVQMQLENQEGVLLPKGGAGTVKRVV